MSDNTLLPGSTSEWFATDDVAGVKYQRFKLTLGNDGEAEGDVSSSRGLPVIMAGVSTEATLAALKTALDALSAKIAQCDTSSVALDSATLTALETITAVVSGTVAVSNFPATQTVDGTVNVGNFPALQDVSVGNFPATQEVSGTVALDAATIAALTPVPESKDAEVIKQDYAANGALIVAQDDHERWRVAMQGQGADGQVRDVALTQKGEVKTAVGDNVVYDVIVPQFANVALYPLGIAGVPAEGFASFALKFSINVSSGAGVQVSIDGVSWDSVNMTYPAGTYGIVIGTAYSANTLYTGSLPACKFVRVYLNNNVANAAARVSFALSRSPRVDYMTVRLADAQQLDGTVFTNGSTVSHLVLGGPDATKKTRPLATDGSVYVKGQGPINNQAGNAASTPYYGSVLTTAIARTAPYPYQIDQPIALQANTRGELQVDFTQLRSMLEMHTLQSEAVYLQNLDPNWGFELR